MPDPKPTPPAGYQIENLPDFMRPANKDTKTVRAESQTIPGMGKIIANVNPSDPQTIMVREPQYFTQPIQTHESTHVFQLSRNPDFTSSIMGQSNASGAKDYDYGGVDGLLNAQNQRKTIADFSAEQQATMVQDYQRLTADAVKRQDAKTLSKITSAYHPFIGQLAAIPPKGADMTKMTKQDLTPAAPLPPVGVAGMPLLPDKLIGGPTGPKVGDSKRFPNDKMGVWDGHGWVAKR